MKINVLGGNGEAREHPRPGFPTRAIALGCVLLLVVSRPFPAGAAEGDPSGGSPLDWCWDRVSTRPELAPCLVKLLREAEQRLAARQARIERAAAQLDRVTSGRWNNVGLARQSDARWHAYRDAECDRQSAAMSPGTGSGDALLACRIVLTNARIRQLQMP